MSDRKNAIWDYNSVLYAAFDKTFAEDILWKALCVGQNVPTHHTVSVLAAI